MRLIKKITVVCTQGVKQYEVGDKVNGLLITRIADNSIDDEGGIHIGFTCYGDVPAKNPRDNTIVEIWDAPVVVEYRESMVKV